MTGSGRPSVAVLGGGMASLVAALELSEGEWKTRFDRITVYQRGWRLGGKGASSRGSHGRIEEHGLHILLGYYDHTFDLMRRCYEELDRCTTDPDCPIRTWDQAVAPSSLVGVTDASGGRWEPWLAEFSRTPGAPGGPKALTPRPVPTSPADIALRSLTLVFDFFASLAADGRPDDGRVRLTSSPLPNAGRTSGLPDLMTIVRGGALMGVAFQLSWLRRVATLIETETSPLRLETGLVPIVQALTETLRRSVVSNDNARRTYHLVELLLANLRGILNDGLLPEGGFSAIDHLDYREWLAQHCMDPAAAASPLLNGMYDLVFGYRDGDPSRPAFSAGLGLQLATRMLVGYSGALFWKMQAGMGEVIFAPLYQVLKRRGVEFRFFHRVDALRLTPDGLGISSIEMGIQAAVAEGPGRYEPLTKVKGLPCWPAEPLNGQLEHPEGVAGVDLESFWSDRRDVGSLDLVAGRDFDVVVFGISLGMIRHVCSDLVDRSADWRAMVDNLGTVATQSLQLWLDADERSLGWKGPEGAVVSGFVKPFDTWASMSHLIAAEDWPVDRRPATIAYFCSSMAGASPPAPDPADTVLRDAEAFLDRDIPMLWPAAVKSGGFRWDTLCDGSTADSATGPGRLRTQYWRANVDPSDLYVQSLPGTDRYRIRPGSSGFENLVVAGDWTDCGLNAGCIEAAALSGRLAAEAVLQRAGRQA